MILKRLQSRTASSGSSLWLRTGICMNTSVRRFWTVYKSLDLQLPGRRSPQAIQGPKKHDKLVQNESFTGGGFVSRKLLVTSLEIALAISVPAVLVFGQSEHSAPAAKSAPKSVAKTVAGDA